MAAGFAALLFSSMTAACGGSDQTKQAEEPADNGEHSFSLSTDDDAEEDVDDGLEVEGLKGRLEPRQIEEGIKPHQRKLSGCYHSALAKAKFLGGSVTLKATVGPDGQVQQANVQQSDLGSWQVERCLLEVVRSMTFAEPKGGDKHADFTLPLDFNSGRGRVVWWDEARIESTMGEHLGDLAACEEQGEVPLDAQVTFYVGNRGEVRSVGLSSPGDAPIAAEWADCAVSVVSGWIMPDPMGKIAKAAFRYSGS